jgi:hypothetical protein
MVSRSKSVVRDYAGSDDNDTVDLDEVHFADLFRDVLQFGIWLFSFQFGPSLSIFKFPHCDCKDLHAKSKLCVEGLNIVATEREKAKFLKKGKIKMKLHLSDIIQR